MKIPVLPPGAVHLMQQLSDDQIPFEELSGIIERFPTISARLIALANSAWSGATKPVTSINDACTRLGFNVVRSTSIALAVSSPFNPNRCTAFDPIRYWLDAMLVAEAAFRLAPDVEQNQTLRTLGLLHNLGLLWMTDVLPDECQRAFQKVAEQPDFPLSLALTERCGFDQYTATSALADAWKLPEALTSVLQQQANAAQSVREPTVEALMLSKDMVKALHLASADNLQHLSYPSLGLEQNEILLQYERLESLVPRIQNIASTLFIG